MADPTYRIKQVKDSLTDLAVAPHSDAYTQHNDDGDSTTVIQYTITNEGDFTGKPSLKIIRVTVEEFLYS
jgi:hypothetical protein